jgi:glycine/D-amino acid oxidase-like deaminating enzyme
MHVEFLIIGQGICGSFLAYELQKHQRSFLIMDNREAFSASRVASGIINPVTGRRIVTTWMIEELLPFAKQAYTKLEEDLRIQCLEQKNIIDFFPTPQMLIAFNKRFAEGAEYLSLPTSPLQFHEQFNYDFGFGIISPCFLVDLPLLLDAMGKRFKECRQLIEETFDFSLLKVEADYIRYKDILADKIIFCDGIGTLHHRYFQLLPFAPNKGELLIVEIPNLERAQIFKYGFNIVPWREDQFWIGASHEWSFENDQPTTAFRERTEAQLKKILKLPFAIVDHWAAVRPATLERRPFVGLHPLYPQLGIFNGMGTKGCSLAPYFAKQFVEHLLFKKALLPEADISRFKNILSK